MENILICANHGGFGGSYNLNRAINRCSTKYRSQLITYHTAPYGFGNGLFPQKNFKIVDALFKSTEKIFICDYNGLVPICSYLNTKYNKKITHDVRTIFDNKLLNDFLKSKRIVFFHSGTNYRNNHEVINKWIGTLNCRRTYAMCDLLWCDPKAMPLMQTFDIEPKLYEKNSVFTLCHTPGAKYAHDEKGSSIIEPIFKRLKEELKVEYNILKGVEYSKTFALRSKSHLFVDQIIKLGGLGKSGMEALLCGVPVLLGNISKVRFEGQYADCPVCGVNDDKELYRTIKNFFNNRVRLNEFAHRSLEWSKRLSFENTVKYIDGSVVW